MISTGKIFTNELNNQIEMVVLSTDKGITVAAVGPTSRAVHTWTPVEARTLRDLLNEIVDQDHPFKSTL